MSQEERCEARARWSALWAQQQKVNVRLSWLYDHQAEPDWAERDAATGRSEALLRELREDLREWSGADEGELTLLVAACEERSTR